MKLQGTADHHQIRIGEQPLHRLARAWRGATADFQVFAKDLTAGAVELLGEAAREVDADAAMVRAFPRHGVDTPIKVLVAFFLGAL